MDRDKLSILYKGPSIDASYQVSVHLGFQRRRLKCEKLTDDIRLTPSDGKSSHYLWQGGQRHTTDDRRWMSSDGKSSHCLWQGDLKILFDLICQLTFVFYFFLFYICHGFVCCYTKSIYTFQLSLTFTIIFQTSNKQIKKPQCTFQYLY
jgi:hypothetical protein